MSCAAEREKAGFRRAPSLPMSCETVLVRLLLSPEGTIGAHDVGFGGQGCRRLWSGASRR